MASVYLIMEREAWEDTPHSAYKGVGDSMRHCALLNELAVADEEDKSYWVKEVELHG